MRRLLTVVLASLVMTVAGASVALAGPVVDHGRTPVPVIHHRHAPAPVPHAAVVRVGGAVSTPATLTAKQISALAQVTLPLSGPGKTHRTVTGALLTDVVATAGPEFDSGKNGLLRASVTITGRFGARVTIAYGELDPGFGNHPALLTVAGNTVNLAVPGDSTRFRSVTGVSAITVTALAAPITTPPAGAITIVRGHRSVTLSAARLARLPSSTRTVSFLSGTAPQTHTEEGPSLFTVLLAAGILPLPDTVVTAVGSDGYGAAVTVGEALFGGKTLLVSLTEDGVALAQPRTVVSGDVKGGRYVSGVVTLVVG